MKKYYAVIDTNVIVSALLKAESCPGKVLEYVKTGIIVPIINDELTKEYLEVLTREKFGLEEELINSTIFTIKANGLYTDIIESDEIFKDKDDVVFYEVLLSSRRTNPSYLVTGNLKDFPIRPFIVTPHEMIDIINNNS